MVGMGGGATRVQYERGCTMASLLRARASKGMAQEERRSVA